ncbi:benzoate transport porin BenP [uncultured Acinetobacter sp.]|uniref:benzoate transport porin BenP n=1 Tax=uncultured Acinetobacter sp. TaxID=165433 RepID=UPI002590F03F|nr:benzoate transport porin BenP [uncultured Acinetobacter sp.]
MQYSTTRLYQFMLRMGVTFGMVGYIGVIPTVVNAQDNWTLSLKNAYIDRDYDGNAVKDTGSWSQGASLFYKSDYYKTPIDGLEIGVDGSVQYAVRLSHDKGVADTILPFDPVSQEQARDYLKYGGTLKLKYDQTELRVGELWPDLPVTAVDRSRQLLTSYQGVSLNSKLTSKLTGEIGIISKVSPRNEEDFRKLTFTKNGIKYVSDGLNYIDLKYQVLPNLKLEYYFGNLENLYNKHYLGADYSYKLSPEASLHTKLKYFNAGEDNKNYNIDSQNFGILETLKYRNHTVGLGYQQIVGDAYPLPDGFLPETYFINWNTTGFFKADEKSVHFIYGYDFKDYVPGLNFTFKHVYGYDFKTATGLKNKEQESNFILNYAFQNPKLKGVGFQWLYIPYKVRYGTDFNENRLFLTYTKKF